MEKIEVDQEVFEFLKRNAEPFVDTPNCVLRRFLLQETVSRSGQSSKPFEATSGNSGIGLGVKNEERNVFVRSVLESEFGGGFKVKRPYQFMFESDDALVYFQNFGQRSDKLWYRIDSKAWKLLNDEQRKSTVLLTNPTERFAYIFPIDDINRQVEKSGWDRDDLEININHVSSRWIDLDWNIEPYLKTF